jgi:hypothetical protein
MDKLIIEVGFASFGSFAILAGFSISAFCQFYYYIKVLMFYIGPDRFSKQPY